MRGVARARTRRGPDAGFFGYLVGTVTMTPGALPGVPRALVGGVSIILGVTVTLFPGLPAGGCGPTTAWPLVYGIVADGRVAGGGEGGGAGGSGLGLAAGVRFGVARKLVFTPRLGGGGGLTAELPSDG